MANQKVRRPETGPAAPRTEPTRPQLASAAATFTLLSNPTRLHVLWLAAQDVHDVTTLAERTGVGVATMSQHLSKLRLAGLISARQDGRRRLPPAIPASCGCQCSAGFRYARRIVPYGVVSWRLLLIAAPATNEGGSGFIRALIREQFHHPEIAARFESG